LETFLINQFEISDLHKVASKSETMVERGGKWIYPNFI